MTQFEKNHFIAFGPVVYYCIRCCTVNSFHEIGLLDVHTVKIILPGTEDVYPTSYFSLYVTGQTLLTTL